MPSQRPDPSDLSTFSSDSSNLDVIRAVAVLSVFFGHLHAILTRSHPMLGWHFARMGVLIFFVHTSMVLMLSLERTKLEGRAMVGSFYLRRFFRIYPLSVFCVTVAMVFHRAPDAAHTIRNWTWPEYLSNVALTMNLTYTDKMVGALWTLPLEVQMYLALPFLFLLGRARPLQILFGLWVVSVPMAILQLHTSARLNVLGYAPCFIAGVIAWKLSLLVYRRFPGWSWPIAFVATWPVFFMANPQNDMYFRWAFCLALGCVIPWFQEIPFRTIRAGAHIIAKYSYGIYLSHVAVMLWCFGLRVPAPVKWGIFAVMAAAAPMAMYHLIEHPMIGVGQKMSKQIFIGKPCGRSGLHGTFLPLSQPTVDEEFRGAAAESRPAHTGKAEVALSKEEDDLLVLDYEPGAGRNPGR